MTMTQAKSSFALRGALVNGTTASSDTTVDATMTVTGIATEDVIIYAEKRMVYTGSTVDELTDVTSTMSITAANTVQSTANTSTNGATTVTNSEQPAQVFILWADASL